MFDKFLVVGVDGQVGGPLADHLQSQGVNVLGTTRRKDRVGNGRVYLDLAEPEENWPALPDVETAILCASVTRLETCENDPTGTAKVNVDGVVALARKLAARGTHILYLSTTGVFDFTEPFRRHDCEPSPVTTYGHQKASAEKQILSLGDMVSVLRLTKVIGPSMPLLQRWSAILGQNSPISAFRDTTIAPITTDFVNFMIKKICSSKAPGIFHASGDADLAYTVLAEHFVRAMGKESDLVVPEKGQAIGQPAGPAPRYTTLDMTRERELFGILPPSSLETIIKVTKEVASSQLSAAAG